MLHSFCVYIGEHCGKCSGCCSDADLLAKEWIDAAGYGVSRKPNGTAHVSNVDDIRIAEPIGYYQKQLNKEDRKEEQPERSDCSSLLGGKWQPQAYFRFTQEKEKQLAMQSVTYSIMSKTRAKQRTAD